MTLADIQNWLRYWKAHGEVNVDEIQSIEDVATARKYCLVMRTGRFTQDAISNRLIWAALQDMRTAA